MIMQKSIRVIPASASSDTQHCDIAYGKSDFWVNFNAANINCVRCGEIHSRNKKHRCKLNNLLARVFEDFAEWLRSINQ